MPLILEGLLTTLNPGGSVNIAPMGPIVDVSMQRMTLRPFHTSRSCANLNRTRQGVFHVTDDVLLLARASIDQLDEMPGFRQAEGVAGAILSDACRWFALQVESIDDSQPRTVMEARVVAAGEQRPFFGFNRAKHAVIEASILATRAGLLPREEILRQFGPLGVIVEKTGGPPEHEAFQMLENFVRTAPHDSAD
jgi:hypothetical protein